MRPIFPYTYFGPIAYFQSLFEQESPCLDKHEHFVKQTYRNRMRILGANGPLDLIVPVIHSSTKGAMQEVRIDFSTSWHKQHWRSVYSAYKNAPYFEYFEHHLVAFYQDIPSSLMELNQKSMNMIFSFFKQDVFRLKQTEAYVKPADKRDWRIKIDPLYQAEMEIKSYVQVFQDRFPFQSNLSILDYLFNQGPNL